MPRTLVSCLLAFALGSVGCEKLMPDTIGDGGVPDASMTDASAPPGRYFDLTIRGSGLGAFERFEVLVVVGDPGRATTERVVRGRAIIREGAFRVFFEDVLEENFPKSKIVILDVDGDGRCTGGEPFYYNGYAAIADASIDLGLTSFGGAASPEACDVLFP